MLRQALWFAAAASSLAACKWTEFDDLADKTWVQSTGKPAVKSSEYGLELLQLQHSGDGGDLAVVGIDEPSLSRLIYDSSGATKLGDAPINLNVQFSINAIPDAPTLIADPASDNFAFIVPSGAGGTAALYGDATAVPVVLNIEHDSAPNSAVFVPGAGSGSATSSALVVSGTGTFHVVDTTANKSTNCMAADADGTTPLTAIQMIAVGANIYAWTATGTLEKFDAQNVITCTDGATTPITPTKAGVALGANPGRGSRLFLVGGRYLIFAAVPDSAMASTAGMSGIGVYDTMTDTVSSTFVTVGTSSAPLGAAALGEVGGTTYLVLGFPSRAVGSVVAGQVDVLEVDPTAGTVDTIAKVQLNDAQPTENQEFGRAVEVMHYNDDAIFVVAADNEIFSYYETTLYPDARK